MCVWKMWCGGLHNFSMRVAGREGKREVKTTRWNVSRGTAVFIPPQRHLARLMNLFFSSFSVDQLERSKMGFSCWVSSYEQRMTTSSAAVSVCVWENSRIAIIGKWMNNKIFFSFFALPPHTTIRMSSVMIHKYYLHVLILKIRFFASTLMLNSSEK